MSRTMVNRFLGEGKGRGPPKRRTRKNKTIQSVFLGENVAGKCPFKCLNVLVFGCSGVWVFRCVGVQVCGCFGVQVFRCLDTHHTPQTHNTQHTNTPQHTTIHNKAQVGLVQVGLACVGLAQVGHNCVFACVWCVCAVWRGWFHGFMVWGFRFPGPPFLWTAQNFALFFPVPLRSFLLSGGLGILVVFALRAPTLRPPPFSTTTQHTKNLNNKLPKQLTPKKTNLQLKP